jgi:anti-anti-sigma factor
MKLKLNSIESDGVIRVAIEGQITSEDFSSDQQNPLEELIGSGWKTGKVLIDFSEATYIDSTAIGWLLSSHKEIKNNGGMMVLHSIPPSVKQIFSLLKIGSVLPLVEDEDAARAAATKQEGAA